MNPFMKELSISRKKNLFFFSRLGDIGFSVAFPVVVHKDANVNRNKASDRSGLAVEKLTVVLVRMLT